MDSRAAVAFGAGEKLSVETVQLDGPKDGDVLVEVHATGICHTGEFTLSGADPEGLFPAILGHEGAGIAVDNGPGRRSRRDRSSSSPGGPGAAPPSAARRGARTCRRSSTGTRRAGSTSTT